MALRSSLYRLTAGRPTVTPEGGRERPATDKEMLGWGYRIVSTFGGDEVVHAAPGVEPPEGAEALKDGRESWAWSDLREENSTLADAVLHATYRTEDAEGNPSLGRGVIREERNKGNIPDAEQSDLPPHAWLGDEE